MPLTGKQRRHLRALAHHLDPVVLVGHGGLTAAVLAQVDAALAAHELVKVRLGTECPDGRDEAAAAIAAGARAEIAQVIGRVIVAYRRKPKRPKVELPTKRGDERRARPKGSKGRRPGARARALEQKRKKKRRGRALP